MNKHALAILAFPALLTLTACTLNPKSTATASAVPRVTSAKELFAQGGGGSKALLGNYDDTRESTDGLREGQKPPQPATNLKTKNPRTPTALAYHHGLSYWIERLGIGGASRATTSTVFRSGDRIRFPTAGGSEYIEPDRTYTLPATGHIRFVDPPGQENVWLFLTSRPLPVNAQAEGGFKQSGGYYPSEAAYNPCGAKDLMVEAPDALQSKCGLGSKDLVVEDDARSNTPTEYAVAPAALIEQGRIMALRVTLRHD